MSSAVPRALKGSYYGNCCNHLSISSAAVNGNATAMAMKPVQSAYEVSCCESGVDALADMAARQGSSLMTEGCRAGDKPSNADVNVPIVLMQLSKVRPSCIACSSNGIRS